MTKVVGVVGVVTRGPGRWFVASTGLTCHSHMRAGYRDTLCNVSIVSLHRAVVSCPATPLGPAMALKTR